jgi:hypothetical protein
MLASVGTFTGCDLSRPENAQDGRGKHTCYRSHHRHTKDQPPSIQGMNVAEENHETAQPSTG